ncbi:MAG: Peroxisomal membrane signal receptor PTS1 [Chaenotheca gracillima]|nr:MAG: Peroxisomal membrane signal receptor PTS1 [Chaenotheca gracillima]
MVRIALQTKSRREETRTLNTLPVREVSLPHILRRSALRVASSTSTAFVARPRSIAAISPFILRQGAISSGRLFQQRFASDDAGSAQSSGGFAARYGEAGDQQQVRAEGADTARPKTIYVGNIQWDCKLEEIEEEFGSLGLIEDAKILTDEMGRSKGVCFVTFADAESAKQAIAEKHQKFFLGRPLTVQPVRPRPSREARPPTQVNEPTKTLFVGNLSFELTDRDLNNLFVDIRNVVDVRVAIDRRTGQPRGFAHADFTDVESAVEGLAILREKKSFHGRPLKLDYSVAKTPYPPRGAAESVSSGSASEGTEGSL